MRSGSLDKRSPASSLRSARRENLFKGGFPFSSTSIMSKASIGNRPTGVGFTLFQVGFDDAAFVPVAAKYSYLVLAAFLATPPADAIARESVVPLRSDIFGVFTPPVK